MTSNTELLQRARARIPGGVNSPVRAFNGVGGDPVFFERMKPFIDQGNAVVFVGTTHVRGLVPMFEDEGYLISQVKS